MHKANVRIKIEMGYGLRCTLAGSGFYEYREETNHTVVLTSNCTGNLNNLAEAGTVIRESDGEWVTALWSDFL